jgi:hypothetical protein
MAQKLIVEGNDAIVLSVLCQKRGLHPPIGFDNPEKYKREFVSVGGNYEKAIKLLELAINKPELNNIGIVVDANNAGANNRWQEIRRILAHKFSPSTLEQADTQTGAKILQETNLPTVGIWVMPDNVRTGYLEHFLADMIPTGDALWNQATIAVTDITLKPCNELTAAKVGKANLHT